MHKACIGLSTQPGELTNPSNLPELELETVRTDHSDVGCGALPTEPDTLRVGWWVSSPETRATRPDHKTKNLRR